MEYAKYLDTGSIILMKEQIYELVFVPIVTGLFGVVGGVIPLIFILYIIFRLIRNSFQKFIASEPERVAKYKQMLEETRQLQTKYNDGLRNNEITLTPEVSEAMTTLTNSIYEYEMEIILREAWIEKIKEADFLSWVRYHFGKTYFADYFKK